MRARWLCVALATFSLSAAPRDPFQPLASPACPPPDTLTHWRLQGVLGRGASLRAWLVAPQGARVAVASATPLPLVGWQLGAITPRSLTLTTGRGCAPQRITFSLKGGTCVQDDTSADGVRPARAGAGQQQPAAQP